MLYAFLAASLLGAGYYVDSVCSFTDLRALWLFPAGFIVCFIGLLLLFLFIVFISTLFIDPKKFIEQPMEYFRFLMNQTCKIAVFFAGVEVHTTGQEKIPADCRFLLICNHSTFIDPILFYDALPNAKLSFLSKKENFNILVVAQLMRATLSLPIDRSNDRESLKSIVKAIQFIKEDKASIAVFPEGGTNKTDEVLLPFKNGVFKIAQKSNAPIVCCTLLNTKAARRRMFRKHTDVYLDIYDAISPEFFKDMTTVELGNYLHEQMEKRIVARKKELNL